MPDKPPSELDPNPFTLSCRAIQNTTWVGDPANPVEAQTGPIGEGEVIWLQEAPFGSGPSWQPARLQNGSVCFVQPHHFNEINE